MSLTTIKRFTDLLRQKICSEIDFKYLHKEMAPKLLFIEMIHYSICRVLREKNVLAKFVVIEATSTLRIRFSNCNFQ